MSSNALMNAMLHSTIENPIAVKAEDVQQGGGIDFSAHYFEPKPGNTYLIKFLPNPNGEPITHRSVYKDLPDPDRKGKTFHYTSSGNAKSCKALELFFELNDAKKNGDAIAAKKIEKYLGKTNQGCVHIQVLTSPIAEEVGIVRMWNFATFGPNATVANLLNTKLNPTKEQLAQGYEKEDIFNIFQSSVMSVVCTETVYDGNKGRDYSKSSWAPKTRGAIAKLETGETREFKADDVTNGVLKPEVQPYFESIAGQILHEDFNIEKWFAYKAPDANKWDKDTNDYLINIFKKVDEIIPVIRTQGLVEIAAYGKADNKAPGGAEKKDNAKNVMAESIPEDLAASVSAQQTQKIEKQETKVESSGDAEIDNILNNG